MAKLNQILAVEKGIKNEVETDFTKLYHLIQKPDPFAGLSRTYRPLDDVNGVQLPNEYKRVQVNVPDVLGTVATVLTRLFDVTASKDWSNTFASASVEVDGKVLLTEVPVTYLLFLEKKLTDLHTFISRLPTLDPNETWRLDENTGLYASEPVQTIRNSRIKEPLVLFPATDKHPAQVQVVDRDVPEGTWTITKLSGAISEPQKTKLLERVRKLHEAVKKAREAANSIDAVDSKVGERLFEYLFSA